MRKLINDITDLVKKGNQKVNDSLDEVQVKTIRTTLENKSEAELKKDLEETNEKIKSLKKELKKDGVIKFLNIIDDGTTWAIRIIVPGGLAIGQVKTRLKPLNMLLCRKKAIHECLRMCKKKSKPAKESVTENFNSSLDIFTQEECNLMNALVVQETQSGFLMGYDVANTAVLSNNELHEEINVINNLIKKSKCNTEFIDKYAEGVCIQEKLVALENQRLTGEKMIYNRHTENIKDICPLYENTFGILRANVGYSDNSDVNTISAIESAINLADLEYGAAPYLIKRVLPLTNMYVLNESSTDTIDLFPKVLKRNIIEEFKVSTENINAYQYILNEAYEAVKDSDNFIYRDEMKVLCESINTLIKDICLGSARAVMESVGPQPLSKSDEQTLSIFENYLSDNIYNLCKDDNDINIEQLTEALRPLEQMELLLEAKGHNSVIWKAGYAVEKKTRKILNNGKGAYDTAGRNSSGFSEAGRNVEKLVNYPLNKIIQGDKEERRTRIVEGRWRLKIWKLVRKAILGKFLWMCLGPVSAAIGIMTSVAADKLLDRKTKNDIIHEMQTELKLTEEKIEDAKADGNKKEKYALMRLRDKLEKDISRINYGLAGKY